MALPALTHAPRTAVAERLSPEDVRLALDAGAVLVDIRSQAARSGQGVLAGALAVDQFALAARCAPGSDESLCRASAADAWWILVSANGLSSLHATRRLRAMGLERVSDVVGGFAALRAARRAFAAASAPHAKRDTATFAAHW
ncbi:MAG: rhodanese-like domain-containing protein [Segniliparus sp.]|uniref:rhodanese-like domain-containing protein n=1 Tax=Segniliparus sp. TaxID=2804064 RepID=UPI003F3FEFD4